MTSESAIVERPESMLRTLRRGIALAPDLHTGLAGTLALAIFATVGRVAVPVCAAYATVRPSCAPNPQSIPSGSAPPQRSPLIGTRCSK